MKKQTVPSALTIEQANKDIKKTIKVMVSRGKKRDDSEAGDALKVSRVVLVYLAARKAEGKSLELTMEQIRQHIYALIEYVGPSRGSFPMAVTRGIQKALLCWHQPLIETVIKKDGELFETSARIINNDGQPQLPKNVHVPYTESREIVDGQETKKRIYSLNTDATPKDLSATLTGSLFANHIGGVKQRNTGGNKTKAGQGKEKPVELEAEDFSRVDFAKLAKAYHARLNSMAKKSTKTDLFDMPPSHLDLIKLNVKTSGTVLSRHRDAMNDETLLATVS